jgi:hypothetical protein
MAAGPTYFTRPTFWIGPGVADNEPEDGIDVKYPITPSPPVWPAVETYPVTAKTPTTLT